MIIAGHIVYFHFQQAPPSIPTPSNGMVSQDMGNQDQPSVPPQSNQPPSMPPQPSGAVMNVSFQVQSQSASVTVPHTDGKGTSGTCTCSQSL